MNSAGKFSLNRQENQRRLHGQDRALEKQFQRILKKAEHDGNHAHAEPPELC